MDVGNRKYFVFGFHWGRFEIKYPEWMLSSVSFATVLAVANCEWNAKIHFDAIVVAFVTRIQTVYDFNPTIRAPGWRL